MTIHTIFTHSLDNGVDGELGIDDQGRLYWNKKPVVTEQKIKLELWVNVFVIIASLATVLSAILSLLQFLGYGIKT